MVNPRVDEQSMMTYLSQFPNAKLDPDAPVKPKSNAARVRAYGPGNLSSLHSSTLSSSIGIDYLIFLVFMIPYLKPKWLAPF